MSVFHSSNVAGGVSTLITDRLAMSDRVDSLFYSFGLLSLATVLSKLFRFRFSCWFSFESQNIHNSHQKPHSEFNYCRNYEIRCHSHTNCNDSEYDCLALTNQPKTMHIFSWSLFLFFISSLLCLWGSTVNRLNSKFFLLHSCNIYSWNYQKWRQQKHFLISARRHKAKKKCFF